MPEGIKQIFVRPRVNALLMQAIEKPVVVVCARMGYGKTLAVTDFVRETNISTIWLQLSELDNVTLSFWGNFVQAVSKINKPLAEELAGLGFPDTEDKLNRYYFYRNRAAPNTRYFTVLDDIHLISNPDVLAFIEHITYKESTDRTLIMIGRELPQVNLSGLLVRDMVFNISESDVGFSESELAQFLLQQGLSSEMASLSEMYRDTEGWAFMINFMTRILKKSPGYSGYTRSVIKQNIFQLMDKEVWSIISEKLQRFLVRLSLVRRPSADLVSALAKQDESLLEELYNQRVAYIRFDRNTGRYLIHQLFLDYLRSKQDMLTPEEVDDTYRITAHWCQLHSFETDAIIYYEMVGDYEAIVSIIREAPVQTLLSSAVHLKDMFQRAPEGMYARVKCFSCAHIRIFIFAGLWQETVELMKDYEKKFLALPEEDELRSHALGIIYYSWGIVRQLMCTVDNVYDFDIYAEKMSDFPTLLPDSQIFESYPIGPCINRAGAARKGAPEEYLDAIARAVKHYAPTRSGWLEGQEALGRGELLFYQGNIKNARPLISDVVESAKINKNFMIVHLALFYSMRIAIWQGDFEKAEEAIRGMEATLNEEEYDNRFALYDIALGWYYCALRQPDKISDWLKGKLTPFSPVNFLENIASHVKARYHYLTKCNAIMLAYIEEQKRQGVVLFERMEMLAMEACLHYRNKDKEAAFAVLLEAYQTAEPNGIIMPFIEMGKDMRTLTLAALKEKDLPIEEAWLKNINKKASMYARHQSNLIAEYRRANEVDAGIDLTSRELKILHDLYKGFSRSEIAENQGLSINTVRLVINTIYEKLKAHNVVDLVRIAHEQKLI